MTFKMAFSSSRLIFRATRLSQNLKYISIIRNYQSLSQYNPNVLSRVLSYSYCTANQKAKETLEKESSSKNDSSIEEEKLEFQAETRMLLDIVAKSLYSDKEVFIRELISNASDALEKFRHLALTNQVPGDRNLEIRIETDKFNKTLIIKDNGIGMTKNEIISNLGTIARSGSKAFIDEIKNRGQADSNIIGKFGVGFYSSFMVSEKVEVYTKSAQDPDAYVWISDGSGTYTIKKADNYTEDGTKIVLHLKTDSRDYADENNVKDIIKKYSNFVGCPIFVNGTRVNTVEPIWLKKPNDVTDQQHNEFYQFVTNNFDKPRFTLHYSVDAPLSIRSIIYIPESKPAMFQFSRDIDAGVALYSRKVLIKSKADNLFPKYLRFLAGVVDCEDIPLNLSRELLQNSRLIGNLKRTLTMRVLKFLQEKMNKQLKEYQEFYRDYAPFLKEGIVTQHDIQEREEIAKLLRFESAKTEPGSNISFSEYIKQMESDQRDIYYIAAPSRSLAESSPYYSSLKTKNYDVLFCYDPYDELVLLQLKSFNNRPVVSAETKMRQDSTDGTLENDFGEGSLLLPSQIKELSDWLRDVLQGKVDKIRAVKNLSTTHPCVITVEEMAAARHFLRQSGKNISETEHYAILKPQLDINPKNVIIQKLFNLKTKEPELAKLIAEQLFQNAMVSADLTLNPQSVVQSMNSLLEKTLEKIK